MKYLACPNGSRVMAVLYMWSAKFDNQPDPITHVCGYDILPKYVNQLIASSIQIIQIDSRHLFSYYMPISLVYYSGLFCDIWTLLFELYILIFCDKAGIGGILILISDSSIFLGTGREHHSDKPKP